MIRASVAFVALLMLLAPPGHTAGQLPRPSEAAAGKARSLFVAHCARCHGVLGAGGEGPSLLRPHFPKAPDDQALVDIIRDGIPGTAMTGAWPLTGSDAAQVASYVRTLSAAPSDEPVMGDPERGAALFEGKGRCVRCHTVGGFGTSRGPDLTRVGARRGTPYLKEAITDPAAALPRGTTAVGRLFDDYLMVRVVDANGRTIRGTRVNEDSFTIQIRDSRGTLHSFHKPQVRELVKEFDRSLMRSYRDTFTDTELDDLVAYLKSLDGTPGGIT